MNVTVKPPNRNIIESISLLLLFVALLFALYDVLSAFFGILTFALIFAVSFAKAFEQLCKILKGRRKLSAFIYSLLLIAMIALPLIYLISALSTHVKEAAHLVETIKNEGLPPLPEWIRNLPMVGTEISELYDKFQSSPKETIRLYEQQIRFALQHIVMGGAGILGVGLQFIAGIIISAIFLVKKDSVLHPVKQTLQHLLGEKDGVTLLDTTGQAIRGVSIGVMGTALIAAIISWIGLVIAGIPFALGLSALIFFLVVIQLGPLVVWIPLVIWAFVDAHTGTAIFLVIWGVVLTVGDTILKPVLIARSGKLPFLVLFLGVIGGLAAWGFTGMFKGAIIMAVFYKLFTSWLESKNTVITTTVENPDVSGL